MSKGFSDYSLPVPGKDHMAINILPNKKVLVFQYEEKIKSRFEFVSEKDAKKCYHVIYTLMQMYSELCDEQS